MIACILFILWIMKACIQYVSNILAVTPVLPHNLLNKQYTCSHTHPPSESAVRAIHMSSYPPSLRIYCLSSIRAVTTTLPHNVLSKQYACSHTCVAHNVLYEQYTCYCTFPSMIHFVRHTSAIPLQSS